MHYLYYYCNILTLLKDTQPAGITTVDNYTETSYLHLCDVDVGHGHLFHIEPPWPMKYVRNTSISGKSQTSNRSFHSLRRLKYTAASARETDLCHWEI